MEKVIEVLNRMQADGVIEKFAIGGGIAAIYYLEPYQTDDIDVFIWPVVVGERLNITWIDLCLSRKPRVSSC